MRREELELTVSGGRRLRTQLAGPADGELVVFHMGTPDSRHLFDGKLAEGAKRGVRHVCSSRPGYVVGGSSAGPCALACAALLPDRVISAAVVSSFAPRSAAGLDWVAGMGTWNLEGFAALEAGEVELARFIADSLRGDADIAASSGKFLAFQLNSCARIGREGIWAWFDDDRAIWGDWDFDPARIEVPVST